MITEHKREYDKRYRINNKDRINRYRDNHKNEAQQYAIGNKDKINQRHKQYRNNHKEKIDEYQKQYRLNHKKESYLRHKNRILTDINYRLVYNLRARFHKALKGNFKNGSAVADLGCGIGEFKQYIFNKFTEGMSWNNYGEWHMDHIVPLSSFNLQDSTQLLKALNYTNYQPLWAKDNLTKHAKLNWCLKYE